MNSALNLGGMLDDLWMDVSRGMMLFGDVEVLYTLIEGRKNIVELGTARGLTSMILASRGGKVTTIDNYKTNDFRVGLESLRNNISKEINRGKVIGDYLRYFNNIDFIHSDTVHAVDMFENESVDLLYIDAGHKYDEVQNDYCNYFHKVKVGGFICFHDYSNVHKAVRDFINDHVINSQLVEEIVVGTLCRTVIKSFRKKGNI